MDGRLDDIQQSRSVILVQFSNTELHSRVPAPLPQSKF